MYKNRIPEVASLNDLKESSKLLLHHQLWVKTNHLNTYDENTGAKGTIKNIKLESVYVEGIAVSDNDVAPIRLILKTSLGKLGYLDVSISGSNLDADSRDGGTYFFNDTFWTSNPKTKYKYTPSMWALIKNEELQLGMTKEQFKFSAGKPNNINYSTYKSGNREQWIYGTQHRSYYYFTNGIFTSQN